MNTLLKQNKNLIITKALNYSIILIFPAFGPVINKTTADNISIYYSSFFLLALLLSLIIKPKAFELNKYYIPVLLLLCGGFTGFFIYIPTALQIIGLAILGITTGRITIMCTYSLVQTVKKEHIVTISSAILLVGYGMLYISNVITPALTDTISTYLIVILIFVLLVSYNTTFNKKHIKTHTFQKSTKKERPPALMFIIIFIIFLTAGITYAGIYPSLKQYMIFERYYNVFPFLIAILFSPKISKKFGFTIFIYLGLSALGLSYFFSMLPSSTVSYFLIQTTLQVGWAFMDLFVWTYGAMVAQKYHYEHYLPYAIATFLAGTFVGSIFISFAKVYYEIHYSVIFNFLTHLPLFIAIILLGRVGFHLSQVERTKVEFIPRSQDKQTYNHPIFTNLTSREKDVVCLLGINKPNAEICTELYISPNTLKTHSRNIYRKLEVKNKVELVQLVLDLQSNSQNINND